MHRRIAWLFVMFLLIFGGGIFSAAQDTPTPEPTLTETPFLTETQTETPLPTDTPTETLVLATEMPLVEVTAEVTAPVVEIPALPEATAEVTEVPTETSSPLPATEVASEPPLTIAFSDNFETDSGAWLHGANRGFEPGVNGQALRIYNSDTPSILNTGDYADLAVEAKFIVNYGTAYLSVRQSAAGDYTASLNAAGAVTLYRAGVAVGNVAVAPSQPEQWRTLRLSAFADIMRVSVDGLNVLTYADPAPLPAGNVAFHATFAPLPENYGTPYPPVNTLLVDDFVLSLPGVQPAATPTMTPSPTATSTEVLDEAALSGEMMEITDFDFQPQQQQQSSAVYQLSAYFPGEPDNNINLHAVSLFDTNRLPSDPVIHLTSELFGFSLLGRDLDAWRNYHWSHDGSQVAYGSGVSIITVSPDNTVSSPVLEVPGLQPSWSIDDTRIVYHKPSTTQIVVRNIADNTETIIDLGSYPLWSPTEEKIAYFALGAPITLNLATEQPDGTWTVSTLATAPGVSSLFPFFWSPNGTKLAYAHTSDIFVTYLNGTTTNLTNNASSVIESYPAWRSDTSLTYVNVSDETILEDNDLSPGGATLLLDPPTLVTGLNWSPDGEWLAYDQASTIYIFQPGGTPKQLTDSAHGYGYPKWRPIVSAPPPSTPEELAQIFPPPIDMSLNPRLTNSDFITRLDDGICSRDLNAFAGSTGHNVFAPANAELIIRDTTIGTNYDYLWTNWNPQTRTGNSIQLTDTNYVNNGQLGNFIVVRVAFDLLPEPIRQRLASTYPQIAATDTSKGYIYIGYAHLQNVDSNLNLPTIVPPPQPGYTSANRFSVAQVGQSGGANVDNPVLPEENGPHLDLTVFYTEDRIDSPAVFRADNILEFNGIVYRAGDNRAPYGQSTSPLYTEWYQSFYKVGASATSILVDPLVLWPILAQPYDDPNPQIPDFEGYDYNALVSGGCQ